MRFEGTSAYVATDDLKVAVNAAITLERPLLVKGEPGTGQTVLALEIAKSLGAPLIEWHIKSTTKALQGLYECLNTLRMLEHNVAGLVERDVENDPCPRQRAQCHHAVVPASAQELERGEPVIVIGDCLAVDQARARPERGHGLHD